MSTHARVSTLLYAGDYAYAALLVMLLQDSNGQPDAQMSCPGTNLSIPREFFTNHDMFNPR